MVTKRFSFTSIFFVFLFGHTFSQEVFLDSIVLVEKSFYGTQKGNQLHDSLEMIPLFDQIEDISTGQFRQSSPGGLATFLYRGYSNRHIPVVWNGLNLQSITNGSFDLSLLPSFSFHRVNFYSGLRTSLMGNNVFSGGFVFEKNLKNVPLFSAAADFSTLQNYGLNLGLHVKRKNTIYNLGVNQRYDQNIFSYDSSQSIVKRLPSKFINTHVVGEIHHQLNQFSSFGVEAWIQASHRDILNDTLFYLGEQKQKDNNLRAHVYYVYQKRQHKMRWGSTYSREKLDYAIVSPFFSDTSTSIVQVLQNGIQYFVGKNQPFHLFLRHRLDIANANFFESNKTRNTLQLGSSWMTTFKAFKLQLSARQDLVDKHLLIPSLHAKLDYNGYALQVYNNYQLPNFNDLYFPFSGNPDLKPEESVSGELSKEFVFQKSGLKANIFAHWIQNLIQWIPTDSIGFLWSPFNQQNVFSRGGELSFQSEMIFKKLKFIYHLSYGYTEATIQSHETEPELKGKQLIYMPRHKAACNLSFQFKNHALGVSTHFTSSIPVTADNLVSLPAFYLGELSYTFQQENIAITVQLRNILNERYQLVNGYPMPLRHGNIRIHYRIW